jgi:hypothetical protein
MPRQYDCVLYLRRSCTRASKPVRMHQTCPDGTSRLAETPGLSAALVRFDKRNALAHAVLKAHGSGAASHQ